MIDREGVDEKEMIRRGGVCDIKIIQREGIQDRELEGCDVGLSGSNIL